MRASRRFLLRDRLPTGPAPLLRDTFARGDSSSALGTCDTGQSWSALTGTWGVASNRGYRVGINTTDCVAAIDVGVAWSGYEALVLATAEFPGLIFDLANSTNYYVVLVNNANRALELFKRVSGTYTLVSASANNVFTASSDVRIKIVRSGASKVVQVAGTPVITATDSSLSATTSVGLRLQTNAGTNNSRWSDITVT